MDKSSLQQPPYIPWCRPTPSFVTANHFDRISSLSDIVNVFIVDYVVVIVVVVVVVVVVIVIVVVAVVVVAAVVFIVVVAFAVIDVDVIVVVGIYDLSDENAHT